MALRSRYREKPVEQPPDIPEPSERLNIEVQADPEAIVAATEPPQPVDEVSATLRQQIEHLRTSQELERRHAQQMIAAQHAQQAQRQPSREEKLSAWRANGGDEGDIAFLEAHPEMIDRHDVTIAAAEAAAQQGFERGTPEHREATRELFHRHLGHQQPQPAAPAEPAPAFFRPEPTRSPAAPPDRSSMYSAPPSRQAPSTGYRVPSSPSQVRLTPEEMQIAAASGISHTEYARHKLTMLKRKASGEIQS
jgi:hypothetical protein